MKAGHIQCPGAVGREVTHIGYHSGSEFLHRAGSLHFFDPYLPREDAVHGQVVVGTKGETHRLNSLRLNLGGIVEYQRSSGWVVALHSVGDNKRRNAEVFEN